MQRKSRVENENAQRFFLVTTVLCEARPCLSQGWQALVWQGNVKKHDKRVVKPA